MTSPNNTVISLQGQSIVDVQGNTWSIINGQVAVNGVVDPTTRRVIEMAFENGRVWQKNADNLWWSKAAPTDSWAPPAGTAVNPIPNIIASPDDTVVLTAAHVITDASGNVWSILNGQVALNGVADPTTRNVIELVYKDGKIWQENAAKLWWSKVKPSDTWNPPPGTPTSPVVVTSTKIWATNAQYAFGDFNDGQNWTGGRPPGPGDTAIIRSGTAVISSTGTGALGEGGLTLDLGATDPGRVAELETTTNVTIASDMKIITGSANGGSLSSYVGNIFVVNGSLTNEGRVNVVAGAARAELDIRLRGATLVNLTVMNETGVNGVLKIFGTTQYGNSGVVNNTGLISVVGGLVDIENPLSGHGGMIIDDNGTLKIGNSFVDNSIQVNGGILEFGPVVVSPNPAWATNPGMQFLGSLSFGTASEGFVGNREVKLDGVWQAGSSLSAVLTNIQPSMAEMTVFESGRKIFDAALTGHYDPTEFTVGHSGSDVTITFQDHPLTAAIPHS